eukprot:CAMPEP_0178924838 /NCGR_PEP_ID=MMETSP0786-20121207/17550_1 /TAXON_ID=186022 /ORGANISM="Thalassionema frauenfeldii, Strain CCMP 1798" /LENGTH=680 /DNA_ID=CAMNT_0020599595 /DNA_START=72 /DNA_END=2114 /DNA_ORIENTATION=+
MERVVLLCIIATSIVVTDSFEVFTDSKKRPSLLKDSQVDIDESENVNIHYEILDDEKLDENSVETREEENEEEDEQSKFDAQQMRFAIQMAQSVGDERGSQSPFPKPRVGAVLCSSDGRVLGQGRSDYQDHAIVSAFTDAGLIVTPLSEWAVSWPTKPGLRKDLSDATLYVTLEPSPDRSGDLCPPLTQLVTACGIKRVVIGCADPIVKTEGAAELHKSGLEVVLGVEEEDCTQLSEGYTKLARSKLQSMARRHFKKTGRPLGFLHCSVVYSDNVEAFARQGNAFGKNFGGKKIMSYRDFGAYGLAPPPEVVWAKESELEDDEFSTEIDDIFKELDFEEEEEEVRLSKNPMMPWYEQVDAVVATFPKRGNGPADDDSVMARLNGLKWLATAQGESLPANVERILVMDATDLAELPLTNNNPNLPPGVNVEDFWGSGKRRKPPRVLLRKGTNAQAQSAAKAAAQAAAAAAEAARIAMEAIESGEAAEAAEAAVKSQDAAAAATKLIQEELTQTQKLKAQLEGLGVVVEILKEGGGDPIDVMKFLGKRNGYQSVVWRAGCWGERGVQAIMDGAFQYVSAHVAVDAVGGKFWQLMLAERAVQAACGPEQKVKVFADQEDLSLEYCDENEADSDCVLAVDGQPIRHVRLDCRVRLVGDAPAEIITTKTAELTPGRLVEQAPWFL